MYTFAIMQVSAETHREVRKKLEAAGYGHAIDDGGLTLDMHGLALQPEANTRTRRLYMLQSRVVPVTRDGHPVINGLMTWDEALAYDHARRGGRVEVDWAVGDETEETDADHEKTREWSLREYPEVPT